MKFILVYLFILTNSIVFCQTLPCNQIVDSVYLESDTMYIQQPADTEVDLGFQWLGFTDLSYLPLEIDYNDSTFIRLNGGTITGGIPSPYPTPFFFNVAIDYLQPNIPPNTVINTFIDVWVGHCEVPITFIINSTNPPVSTVLKSEQSIEASVFPNPITSNSILELSHKIKGEYRITIYDKLGRVVHQSNNLQGRNQSLQRSIFNAPGVYFLRIEANQAQFEQIPLLVN